MAHLIGGEILDENFEDFGDFVDSRFGYNDGEKEAPGSELEEGINVS